MNTLPETPGEIDYICGKLDSYIHTFHSSVAWYRRVYFYTSIAILIFSGLITLITGWKPELQIGVKAENLVLIFASLITVISGWGMFFSPKDSWLVFASSLNRLRALKTRIEFMKSRPNSFEHDGKLSTEFYEEFQAIFDAHNKAWLELRMAPNPALNRDAAQKRVAT